MSAADVTETKARAVPRCPHFGVCGGCQLQDVAYDAQLAGKAARLTTLLAASGLALPEMQLHASPPYGYRNRIRLTLAGVGGELRAGYLTSTANEQRRGDAALPAFLPITECPIAAPILWRATEAVLGLLNRQDAWLGDSRISIDQLELFTTADELRLQLSFYLRTALKNPPAKQATAFAALCEALRAQIPELSGAGIFYLPPHSAERSRRNEQPRSGPVWGAPGMNYAIPLRAAGGARDATYWIPRGAFFQVNRFLLPELLDVVTAGRSGALAFDLYAGVGLFSRVLATQYERVTAVEIGELAASALGATKLRNLYAVKATTLDFLRAAVIERDRPGLIVLDPPRAGAGREVCELLGRIAAPMLVYVSCSPEMLAADVETFAAAGYAVAELHLFDLFPQTPHLETVAMLTRGASAKVER